MKKRLPFQFRQNKGILLFADEYMIDTVIRNLISNALKFTPNEGDISIQFKAIDQRLCTEIKDSGIGISSSNQEKLFRLDTNYIRMGTAEETGTGLGLILCKEFVELNNGAIFVQSEVGKGSSFYFYLTT